MLAAQTAVAQTVVHDEKTESKTKLMAVINQVSNFFRENMTEILEWGQRAIGVVNSVIKNWEMATEIVEEIEAIRQMGIQLLAMVNNRDDIKLEEKIRLARVALELKEEANGFVSIFNSIFTDGITMDDQGRIRSLRETFVKVTKIRRKYQSIYRRISRMLHKRGSKRNVSLQLRNLFRHRGDPIFSLD